MRLQPSAQSLAATPALLAHLPTRRRSCAAPTRGRARQPARAGKSRQGCRRRWRQGTPLHPLAAANTGAVAPFSAGPEGERQQQQEPAGTRQEEAAPGPPPPRRRSPVLAPAGAEEEQERDLFVPILVIVSLFAYCMTAVIAWVEYNS